jgi:hypothetical protein
MANIYISHTNKDRELATRIAAGLREAGQKVFIDFAELIPGDEWRSALASALGQADIILALITRNSESSKWMMTEIGAARAYQQVRDTVRLIPVVVGEATLPSPLADIQAIISEDGDVAYIVTRVLEAITRMVGVDAGQAG